MHYLAPEHATDSDAISPRCRSPWTRARMLGDARPTTTADSILFLSLSLSFSLSRCAPPREYGCGLVRACATKTQDETSVGHLRAVLSRGSSRLRVEHHCSERVSSALTFTVKSRCDLAETHDPRTDNGRTVSVRVYREWKKNNDRSFSRSSLSHASAGSCTLS